MTKTVFRTCTLCEACCGLRFEVEGDRILSVRPDPDDPISKGYACPKGIAIAEVHDDPDRLRTPLRRRQHQDDAPAGLLAQQLLQGRRRRIGGRRDDGGGVVAGGLHESMKLARWLRTDRPEQKFA